MSLIVYQPSPPTYESILFIFVAVDLDLDTADLRIMPIKLVYCCFYVLTTFKVISGQVHMATFMVLLHWISFVNKRKEGEVTFSQRIVL